MDKSDPQREAIHAWKGEKWAKRCPRCEEVKPASEFHKNRANASRLHTYCTDCSRDKSREYYQRNGEKIRERNREHSKTLDRATRRRYTIKHLYGISDEQYSEMLIRQGGKCAICQKPPRKRALNIDHDHDTGRIRGLLCHRCNHALGLFWDDRDVIRRALEHLDGE